jgi:hypothetical protein
MRRVAWIAPLLWMLLAAASASAEAELPLPEETFAKAQIQSMRDASRDLRRLSRAARDAPKDAAWLEQARDDIESLSGRWASALVYFGRDFPPDALRADPERYAYAKEWLAERNGEFAEQQGELRQRLLTEAGELSGGRAEEARKALEDMGGEP